MQVVIEWGPVTAQWMSRLSEAPRDLGSEAANVAFDAILAIRDKAQTTMPVFEATMQQSMYADADIRMNANGEWEGFARTYFGPRTFVDPIESVDLSIAPFHYPLGVERGTVPHKVWFFNKRAGGEITPARAKLIRWARRHGVIPSDVPDVGGEAAVREALGDEHPPFMWVSWEPPVPFLEEAFESVVGPMNVGTPAKKLRRKLFESIRRVWTR